MYRISNIKIPVNIKQTDELFKKEISKKCRISSDKIKNISIRKRSIDARKKDNVYYIYSLDADISGKLQLNKTKDTIIAPNEEYILPECGSNKLEFPPVIVGLGPAGLLCGLLLARRGFKPIIIERGSDVESRTKDVEEFWKTGKLKPDSNVQFGEGGAGTFSDGKLNTMVKDTDHRNAFVLREFVNAGANPEIAYINKPHVGTDKLAIVVKNIREEIISLGGQVLFKSTVTGIENPDSNIKTIIVNNDKRIDTELIVLAIGHSARDTFKLIYEKGFNVEQKSFAIGLRVSHPQTIINESQYGSFAKYLPAADYKLVHKCADGRGVYSFCMCPGGYVVNSSSEEGGICVNGMSYSGRDSEFANSAIVCTVSSEDYESDHPLAGVEFQRKYERACYDLTSSYKVPVQKLIDFKNNKPTDASFEPKMCLKGSYVNADLNNCLPNSVATSIKEGMADFGHKIKGFDDDDVMLLGVETRTSSPVRITRDNDTLESNYHGIYPCGEGAGYAGGIMSAAMDGMKVAEKIIKKYFY